MCIHDDEYEIEVNNEDINDDDILASSCRPLPELASITHRMRLAGKGVASAYRQHKEQHIGMFGQGNARGGRGRNSSSSDARRNQELIEMQMQLENSNSFNASNHVPYSPHRSISYKGRHYPIGHPMPSILSLISPLDIKFALSHQYIEEKRIAAREVKVQQQYFIELQKSKSFKSSRSVRSITSNGDKSTGLRSIASNHTGLWSAATEHTGNQNRYAMTPTRKTTYHVELPPHMSRKNRFKESPRSTCDGRGSTGFDCDDHDGYGNARGSGTGSKVDNNNQEIDHMSAFRANISTPLSGNTKTARQMKLSSSCSSVSGSAVGGEGASSHSPSRAQHSDNDNDSDCEFDREYANFDIDDIVTNSCHVNGDIDAHAQSRNKNDNEEDSINVLHLKLKAGMADFYRDDFLLSFPQYPIPKELSMRTSSFQSNWKKGKNSKSPKRKPECKQKRRTMQMTKNLMKNKKKKNSRNKKINSPPRLYSSKSSVPGVLPADSSSSSVSTSATSMTSQEDMLASTSPESSPATGRVPESSQYFPNSESIKLVIDDSSFLDLVISGSLGLIDKRRNSSFHHQDSPRRRGGERHDHNQPAPPRKDFIILGDEQTGIPLAVCALKSSKGKPVVRIYTTQPRTPMQKAVITTEELGITNGNTSVNSSNSPTRSSRKNRINLSTNSNIDLNRIASTSTPLYTWAELRTKSEFPAESTKYYLHTCTGEKSKFRKNPSFIVCHTKAGSTELNIFGPSPDSSASDRMMQHDPTEASPHRRNGRKVRDSDTVNVNPNEVTNNANAALELCARIVVRTELKNNLQETNYIVSSVRHTDTGMILCMAAIIDELMEFMMRKKCAMQAWKFANGNSADDYGDDEDEDEHHENEHLGKSRSDFDISGS